MIFWLFQKRGRGENIRHRLDKYHVHNVRFMVGVHDRFRDLGVVRRTPYGILVDIRLNSVQYTICVKVIACGRFDIVPSPSGTIRSS